MVGIAAPHMPTPSPLDELRPTAPVSAQSLVPAGFLRRSAAALVDGLVLIGFLFLDYYVLVSKLGWSIDRQAAGAVDVVFYLVALGFFWAYCALSESSGAGRTPGKRLLGLAVRGRDGEVPGFGRATLRFAARFLTLATALLGWLLILVTGRRQSLHDLIAGTIVVVDDRAPA